MAVQRRIRSARIAKEEADGAVGVIYRQVAASSAIANTATETAFDKFPTIIADSLVAGSHARFSAAGLFSTGITAATWTARVRYGGIAGVIVLDFPAVTITISQTDRQWRVDGLLGIRTDGASGTAVAHGYTTSRSATGVSIAQVYVNVPTPGFALDTTANKDLVVTWQWSAADASHSVVMHDYFVEIA